MMTALTPWLAAVAFAVAAAAPGGSLAESARGLRLLAPGPVEVVAADPSFSPACQPVANPSGCVLPCLPGMAVRLVLRVTGYEPRRVELRDVPGKGEVNLLDEQWIPTPVSVGLEPAELAADVRAVWIADGEIKTAPVSDGKVEGPRVAPGGRFAVALVGPTTRPVLLAQLRSVVDEPLPVRLEPGSSAALVCRDPWNGAVVRASAVELGSRSATLKSMGSSRMRARGKASEFGDLWVLDIEREATTLVIRAPGFPTTLRDLRDLAIVANVPLEPAHELDVTIEDAKDGRRIAGGVRITQDGRDGRMLVAEAEVEPGAQNPVVVAAGRYTVFAEVAGYRPATVEISIDKPRTAVTLRVARAATARGQVFATDGKPVAGASVFAMTPSFAVESTRNAATSDATGAFDVTLPGDGPWTLLATSEGLSGRPVTVETPSDEVRLVLEPVCNVALLPLQPDGTLVATGGLVLVQLATMTVVMPHGRGPDGASLVKLAPGEWIAMVESAGLRGTLLVPQSCTGWQTTVVLTPAGNPGKAPPSGCERASD